MSVRTHVAAEDGYIRHDCMHRCNLEGKNTNDCTYTGNLEGKASCNGSTTDAVSPPKARLLMRPRSIRGDSRGIVA